MSAKYWTFFHRRFTYWSLFWLTQSGPTCYCPSRSKRFGVSASRSSGESETLVIGRLIKIATTSHTNVTRDSSSSRFICFFNNEYTHLTNNAYESFPYTAEVGSSWWIKFPLNASLIHFVCSVGLGSTVQCTFSIRVLYQRCWFHCQIGWASESLFYLWSYELH